MQASARGGGANLTLAKVFAHHANNLLAHFILEILQRLGLDQFFGQSLSFPLKRFLENEEIKMLKFTEKRHYNDHQILC